MVWRGNKDCRERPPIMRVVEVIVRRHGDRVLSRCWVAGVVRPRPLDWSIYLNIAVPAALMNQHLDDQACQWPVERIHV
jgi:hypothetical protein